MDSDSRVIRPPLLVTVGGSPAPVLAQLLTLRPDQAHVVVSAESLRVWDRAMAAYQSLEAMAGRDPDPSVAVSVVAAHDLLAIETAVEGAARAWPEWSVAYAGGTPAMSAAAVRVWWRSGQQANLGAEVPMAFQSAAWYVAENGDAVVNERGGVINVREILGGRSLSLAQLLRLNDVEPLGSDEHWRLVQSDESAAEVRGSLEALPQQCPAVDRPAADARLQQVVTTALATVTREAGVDIYAPTKAAVWHGDARVHVDLPIAVVTGFTLRLFECLGYQPDDRPAPASAVAQKGPRQVFRRQVVARAKEALFEAQWKARLTGGTHGRAACLCTAHGRFGALVAETLWADLGPVTSPDDLVEVGTFAPEPVAAFSMHDLQDELVRMINGWNFGPLGRWLIDE